MEEVFIKTIDLLTGAGIRILAAIVIWIIGRMLIRQMMKHIRRSVQNRKQLADVDRTVSSFSVNVIETLLLVALIVLIVGVLGIPMASVAAVLASAGVAIGMALQGALGNVAGGIMLMLFRPFSVGDYVDAGSAEGTVSEISLFYTRITTPQNTVITVPNGSLMAGNITNYTANSRRRVDLVFHVGKDTDLNRVLQLMLDTINDNELILKDPAALASVTGQTETALQLTARAWTESSVFLKAKESLILDISQAFADAKISLPAVRVIAEGS